MKKIHLTIAAMAITGMVILTGCANKTQTGALVGAGSGALVGSMVGDSKSAAIGAVIGGVAGGAIGHNEDKKDGREGNLIPN